MRIRPETRLRFFGILVMGSLLLFSGLFVSHICTPHVRIDTTYSTVLAMFNPLFGHSSSSSAPYCMDWLQQRRLHTILIPEMVGCSTWN